MMSESLRLLLQLSHTQSSSFQPRLSGNSLVFVCLRLARLGKKRKKEKRIAVFPALPLHLPHISSVLVTHTQTQKSMFKWQQQQQQEGGGLNRAGTIEEQIRAMRKVSKLWSERKISPPLMCPHYFLRHPLSEQSLILLTSTITGAISARLLIQIFFAPSCHKHCQHQKIPSG